MFLAGPVEPHLRMATHLQAQCKLPMKLFISLVLWCLLLAVCWPLALVMLIIFPLLWLILLPFKIVGLSIELVFKLVSAVLLFPFRVLSRT